MAEPEQKIAAVMGLGELATAIDTISKNIEDNLAIIKNKRDHNVKLRDQKDEYQRDLAVEIKRLGIKTRRQPKTKEEPKDA